MQKETILQENLRKKIQHYLDFFQNYENFENTTNNINDTKHLEKLGLIIKTSQLPDLYSRLRIPFDKNKAFIFNQEDKENYDFHFDKKKLKHLFSVEESYSYEDFSNSYYISSKNSSGKKTKKSQLIKPLINYNIFPVIPFIMDIEKD